MNEEIRVKFGGETASLESTMRSLPKIIHESIEKPLKMISRTVGVFFGISLAEEVKNAWKHVTSFLAENSLNVLRDYQATLGKQLDGDREFYRKKREAATDAREKEKKENEKLARLNEQILTVGQQITYNQLKQVDALKAEEYLLNSVALIAQERAGLELVSAKFGTDKVKIAEAELKYAKATQDVVNAQLAVDEKRNETAKSTNSYFQQMLGWLSRMSGAAQSLANIQKQIGESQHDRLRFSVGELADRGRDKLDANARMTRSQRRRRGLRLTSAEASALEIESLEGQSRDAIANGNEELAGNLQNRAEQMRQSNPALRSSERDPYAGMNKQLAEIVKTMTSGAAKTQVMGG